MTAPLIHVGYHKTGTTWLQHRFFPVHAGFSYVATHEDMWPVLMKPHEFEFDLESARQQVNGWLQRCAPARVPVLSGERLSGNPHSGGYDAGIIARRLHALMPDARILIVVREQAAALLSNYKQYVRMGGAASFERYLNPPCDGRIPWFRLDNFAYDLLVRFYLDLFGRERVCVLAYESFLEDPNRFLSDICAFVGLSPVSAWSVDERVNEGLPDRLAALTAWVNRMGGTDSLFPHPPRISWIAAGFRRMLPVAERLPWSRKSLPAWRQHAYELAGKHYRESNQRLARLTGLPLEKWGYVLADETASAHA